MTRSIFTTTLASQPSGPVNFTNGGVVPAGATTTSLRLHHRYYCQCVTYVPRQLHRHHAPRLARELGQTAQTGVRRGDGPWVQSTVAAGAHNYLFSFYDAHGLGGRLRNCDHRPGDYHRSFTTIHVVGLSTMSAADYASFAGQRALRLSSTTRTTDPPSSEGGFFF